jgi:hypothetical protein
MKLSPEELQIFKDAYRKAFGEDLDDVEANDLAYRLEELYRVILTKPETSALDESLGPSSP